MEYLGGDGHEAVGKVSLKFREGERERFNLEMVDFRVINI